MTSVVIDAASNVIFHTTANLVVNSIAITSASLSTATHTGASTTIRIISSLGQTFDTTANLNVDGTDILQANLVSITSTTIPTASGTLHTALTGTGMTSVIITAASSGTVFHSTNKLVVNVGANAAESTILSADIMSATQMGGTTATVVLTSNSDQIFDMTEGMTIGQTQVTTAELLSVATNISSHATVINQRANVAVRVSNNGIDTGDTNATFTYVSTCIPGYYCPRNTSQPSPCPIGHFCPHQGMVSPMACPKGTYQYQITTTYCRPCPSGTFCPKTGMSQPTTCPAGTLCAVSDDLGSKQYNLKPSTTRSVYLDHGLTDVPLPCPSGHSCKAGMDTANAPRNVNTEVCHREFPDYDCHAVCNENSHGPCQCKKEYFCSEGTSSEQTTADHSPQKYTPHVPNVCFAGFHCTPGSSAPQGNNECLKGYYCPGFDVSESVAYSPIRCERGNMCNQRRMTEAFSCPAGTFQSEIKSTSCTPCTSGFICPPTSAEAQTGLIEPSTCPPGFTCERENLAFPQDRCPAGYYCKFGMQFSSLEHCIVAGVQDCHLKVPQECQPGVYCIEGIVSNARQLEGSYTGSLDTIFCNTGDVNTKRCTKPTDWDTTQASFTNSFSRLNYPAQCLEGTYCENATSSPAGTALCPEASFCPSPNGLALSPNYEQLVHEIAPYMNDSLAEYEITVNAAYLLECRRKGNCDMLGGLWRPIDSRLGHYSSGVGNNIDSACSPGTYSPTRGLQTCLDCTAGNQCTSYCCGGAISSYCSFVELMMEGSGEIYDENIHCSALCKSTSPQCPDLCSAGFVCNELGTALQSRACMPGFSCSNGTNVDVRDGCDSELTCDSNYVQCPEALLTSTSNLLGLELTNNQSIIAEYSLKNAEINEMELLATCTGRVYPKKCDQGLYCLEQVSERSPFVLSTDTLRTVRPSLCTAGYFCEEGSNTPQGLDGQGICPAGSYCPTTSLQGSSIPTKADLGYFVGITGRSFPEICPAGRYADATGMTECLQCENGNYCYDSTTGYGVITMIPCPAGKYKDELNKDSLECLDCPAGRYGASIGIADFEFGNPPSAPQKCDKTPAGMICDRPGLNRLPEFVATVTGDPEEVQDNLCSVCSEGNFCPEKTFAVTSEMACPEGFFCSKGTTRTKLYSDARLCDAGYICARGTPLTTKTSVICPFDHFCPSGTTHQIPCPPGTHTNSAVGQDSIHNCLRSNVWLPNNGGRVVSINPASSGIDVRSSQSKNNQNSAGVPILNNITLPKRRLDPYALNRNPTEAGEWLNPPLLSRDESTFMLHICGYSTVHLDFDFYSNPILKRLMLDKKVVYGKQFRIAVYFGKAPGFPSFGMDGSEEVCNTESINKLETHTNQHLRTQVNYDDDQVKRDRLQAQWKTLRSSTTNLAVIESIKRPIFIDWNDWHSCEWCLYGDAMPSKCIRRVDPFASPVQYSYVNYFSAYNDQMFDECEDGASRQHATPCADTCATLLTCVTADDFPLTNLQVLQKWQNRATDTTFTSSIRVTSDGVQYPTWQKYFESRTAPGSNVWSDSITDLGNECCQPTDPNAFHDADQRCIRYKPQMFTSTPRHRRLDDDLSANLRGERDVCLSFCSGARDAMEKPSNNPNWRTAGLGYGANPGPSGTLNNLAQIEKEGSFLRQALPKSFRRASIEDTVAIRLTDDAKQSLNNGTLHFVANAMRNTTIFVEIEILDGNLYHGAFDLFADTLRWGVRAPSRTGAKTDYKTLKELKTYQSGGLSYINGPHSYAGKCYSL
jgi:hypothetical protein